MPQYRYQALGPLLSGEGSRAFLGLAIAPDSRARPVVIIWVPPGAETDKELLNRIEKETEHASKLDHPHIVTVLGFAKLAEGHARVVEFADGESLRKVIDVSKRIPPRIAARIVCDACTGVHYAHIAGNDDGSALVHGDLRPETILVTFSGLTKVTGYGALAFAPREMGGQRVKGRRVHSAPEQVIGGRTAITIPTDVYLLGLMLYECLTGIVPWADQGDFFDHAVLTLPLPPPPPGSVPEALEQVILKACSKKAAERYSTPRDLREAIEVAAKGDLATPSELAAFLEAHFPQSHRLRADRRHTIDAGIADFVRRQWAEQQDMPAGAPPGPQAETPAASNVVPLKPKPVAAEGKPLSLAAAALLPDASEDEPLPAKREDGLGWLVALALFVALIAGWWGWRKAHQPIPGREPETPSLATKPQQKPTADAAGVSAKANALSADAAGLRFDAAVVRAVDGGAAVDAGGTIDASVVLPEVDVRIDSNPPGDLFLDGQSLGKTPYSGRLPPGRKVFRVENKPIFLNATRVITIRQAPIDERLTFAKGQVAVTAPQGATVFIDGIRIGVAPIADDISVYEGSHRISVHLGQAKWTEPFSLYEGQKVSFNVELE